MFHITRLHETSVLLRRKIDAVKHKQRDIGLAIKAGGGKEAVEQARKLKLKVAEYETVLGETEGELLGLGLGMPNDTWSGTPVGGEEHAVELERLGRAVTSDEEARGADPTRDHLDVAQYWDWVDVPASATATGSSWVYLKGTLALLEQALVQYALSVAVGKGWTPVVVPDVVKEDIMSRCGFTPRDPTQVGQTYYVTTMPPGTEDAPPPTGPNLVLAATAEIPLAALSANKVLPAASLPLKYVGVSHAFRAEAGARGADTRGLYRLHQFTKVELFTITSADTSDPMMEELVALQKEVVRGLGLSARVLEMPSEELGAPAWRKVDMEAWMPGRGKWGEVRSGEASVVSLGIVSARSRNCIELIVILQISSTSNCTDYQSRRLHIRYRPTTPTNTADSLPFAHTLNGTCAAIPRLLIALIENGVVLKDGKPVGMRLPSVLRRFWYAGEEIGEGERKGKIEWV